MFPAFLLLFAKRLRVLLGVWALLCLAALAWRGLFLAMHCGDPHSVSCEWAQYHNERASDTRFDSILYGVIATLLLTLAPQRFVSLIRRRRFWPAHSICCSVRSRRAIRCSAPRCARASRVSRSS